MVRLKEPFKRYGRRRTQSIDTIPMETLTNLQERSNALAFDLSARILQGGTHSLVFSPLSIHIALSMILAGARGSTAGEISDVLRMSELWDQVHEEYDELMALMDRIGRGPKVDLAIANSLWAQLGYELLSDYTDLVQTR